MPEETPGGQLAETSDHDNLPPVPPDKQTGIAQELTDTDSAGKAVVAAPDSQSGQEQALAEFAKREQEGSLGIETAAPAILEDPSNTTFDADFPGAWHLPGTAAAMKIGGYVNLALVNSFDPMLISDRFIVGSIPPDGQNAPGAKAGTEVTASQTRINFEVREETSQGPLRAFVEADFEGPNDSFRLRHAFGQYRWILAGKTWSTLMDIDSLPEEVDFEGINGQILARQAQIRIFPNFGQSMNFKLALEDPRTDVIDGVGTRGSADLIASIGYLPFGQLGRRREQRAIFFAKVMQASPGEEIRSLSADDVMGAEGIGADIFPNEFIDFPERHVGGAVVSQARQNHTAKQDIQNERPVITDRDRDQSQCPQQPSQIRR